MRLVRNTVMREARRKAHEVLEFTGLAARADVLASDLVPAEKRRLEVARALATEPKLLLLDEVLTGLTPTEAQTGVALVRKVRDTGITVLMVEHVMEIVMPLVDRAIVLDLGKVLVEGKPADVVRDPKVIKRISGRSSCCRCMKSRPPIRAWSRSPRSRSRFRRVRSSALPAPTVRASRRC